MCWRNPLSLFDQCLALCAKYVHHIDSLVDFPPDFSEKILLLAFEQGLFTEDSEVACSALRLYGETDSLFSQLRVPNLLVLNEFEQSIFTVMLTLRSLDLTGLSLDNGHDILEVIPQCDLLQVLILEGTNLSDKGLRKITYPAFGARKLKNLHYLDLSGLHISPKYLNTLRHVPQLTSIVFFQGQVKEKMTGFKEATRPCLQKVTTSPLLVKLLINWAQSMQNWRRAKKVEKTGFYGNHVAEAVKTKPVFIKERKNKVMYNKQEDREVENLDTSGEKIQVKPLRKWKRIPQITLPKEIHFNNDDIEDEENGTGRSKDDNSYIRPENATKTAKRKRHNSHGDGHNGSGKHQNSSSQLPLHVKRSRLDDSDTMCNQAAEGDFVNLLDLYR